MGLANLLALFLAQEFSSKQARNRKEYHLPFVETALFLAYNIFKQVLYIFVYIKSE